MKDKKSRFIPCITKLALSVSLVSSLLITLPNTALADLSESMDKVFGNMTNQTDPGVFESSSRGVLSGGRIVTKAKVMGNPTLVGFDLPDAKGGCGGIDIYGGSLSFINSDQIVQFFRTVAANATGLAFQLAIDAVAPTMSTQIENFQKKVQQMNALMSNSCEMAQGIVTKGEEFIDSGGKETLVDSQLIETSVGAVGDFFTTWGATEGTNTYKQVKDHAPEEYKELVGNIIWKELKKNKVGEWFGYKATDTEILETIMTVTGTLIIEDIADGGDDEATPKPRPIPGQPDILEQMVFGSKNESVSILDCANDTEQCFSAATKRKPVNITGFAVRVEEMFIGRDGNPGIIAKWRTVGGEKAFTTEEIAFISNMPIGLSRNINRLAMLSPEGAEALVQSSAKKIAVHMMYDLLRKFSIAASQAVATSDNANASNVLHILRESRGYLRDEYEAMVKETGDISEIMAEFNEIIPNVRKLQYITKQS